MRIVIHQRGRLKDRHVEALRDEYCKRFKRFGKIRVEERDVADGSAIWPQEDGWRILVDECGEQVSSPQLAQRFEQASIHHGTIHVAIGEAYGHTPETAASANWQWSLGRLVLPHRIAHLVVVEQCYRAATILAGMPYHHA